MESREDQNIYIVHDVHLNDDRLVVWSNNIFSKCKVNEREEKKTYQVFNFQGKSSVLLCACLLGGADGIIKIYFNTKFHPTTIKTSPKNLPNKSVSWDTLLEGRQNAFFLSPMITVEPPCTTRRSEHWLLIIYNNDDRCHQNKRIHWKMSTNEEEKYVPIKCLISK